MAPEVLPQQRNERTPAESSSASSSSTRRSPEQTKTPSPSLSALQPVQESPTEQMTPKEEEEGFKRSRGGEEMNNGRSVTNVIKRISGLLERYNMHVSTSYKESDFKQYWMPDSNCKECYECGDKFTTFRRRHHCRICGQIFCSRCCNQGIPGKLMGYTG